MLRLYELLAGRGVEVVLAASDGPDHAPWATQALYRTWGPRTFSFSPNLLSILGRQRPDLVHLHGLWTYGSIASQIWRTQTGKPVVISPHGMIDRWALQHHSLRKRIAGAAFEWSNLRRATCIHALTEGEAKSLKDLGSYNNIIQIPNGVDLPSAVEESEPAQRTLLYIGRLHAKKGIAETLVAWSLFQKKLAVGPSRWRFLIAGWDDGGHLAELHRIVDCYNLGDHVKFVGPVFGNIKQSMYASADATILASHSEGLPMTVLETWASGKPAFITDECNLPEGFRAGAAFKITTDPQNIAEVLAEILPNRDRLQSAGKAARSLAERSFSWKNIADSWLSLYTSLVHQ